jgi:hypothetical protein
MGMALRVRVAAGWCNLSVDCWAWWVGGTKAGDEELREKEATCCGCWVGEELGELLDSEDRSEDALLMDTRSVSVNSLGQNSISSSRSNDLLASNWERKLDTEGVSVSSRMLLTPRKWRCEFCETERRGAPLRLRPPWWLWETEGAAAVGWWCCCWLKW